MNVSQVKAAPRLRGGPSRLRAVIVLAVVAVAVAAAAVALGQPTAGGTVPTGVGSGAVSIGQVPPSFQVAALDGTTVSPETFRGRPLWLTIGASWCPDCRAEAAEMQAVYEKYQPKGLAILSVFDQEDAATVKDYAKRIGFTMTLAPDPTGVIRRDVYKALGIPTHYFIGTDGTIKAIRVGRLPAADMEALVAGIVGN